MKKREPNLSEQSTKLVRRKHDERVQTTGVAPDPQWAAGVLSHANFVH
jgi:hypothetical protein